MISSRNLDELPSRAELAKRCQSLAMLDAIHSPEWQYRYHSYDASWSETEHLASMRDGSGDSWQALISDASVLLWGLAHESPMFRPNAPWPGVLDALPAAFESALEEPAFDFGNLSFCLWYFATDDVWHRGNISYPSDDDPDGSETLLSLLDGRAESYVLWAEDYFEREVDAGAVTDIYHHVPLTTSLVAALNRGLTLQDVRSEAEQMGYPIGD